MKQFSFGTFLVDETNREAFETCRQIANLEYEGIQPLIILADKGCGKTHLLYAVVNRTRANTAKTGVACINANDFPQEVLDLIRDPSPVKRAQSAILLVDDLDRFRDRLDEVEALVRIFLDHGHAVVISLSIHSGRLTHLPRGLKALLADTKLVTILPESSHVRVELIEREAKEQNDSLIAELQSEIESLKEQLALGGAPETEGDSGLKEEIEELKKALEEKEVAGATLEKDLENALSENALLEVTARENAPLRQAVEDLQERLDETIAEAEGMAELDRSIEDLRKAVVEEKAHTEAAETKAKELERHAESLLDEVDRSRALFAEAKHEQDNLLSDIRQLQAVLTGDDAEMALPPSFGSEVAGLQEEIARITDERDNARRDLTGLMEDTQSARDEIDRLRETVAHGAGELESVKKGAAGLESEREALEEKLTLLGKEKDEAGQRSYEAPAQEVPASEDKDVLAETLVQVEEMKANREEVRQLQGSLEAARDRHSEAVEKSEQFEQAANELNHELEKVTENTVERVAAASAHAFQAESKLEKIAGELDTALRTNRDLEEKLHALQWRADSEGPSPGRMSHDADEETEAPDTDGREAPFFVTPEPDNNPMPEAPTVGNESHETISSLMPTSVEDGQGGENVLEPLEPLPTPDFGEGFQGHGKGKSALHHVEDLEDSFDLLPESEVEITFPSATDPNADTQDGADASI